MRPRKPVIEYQRTRVPASPRLRVSASSAPQRWLRLTQAAFVLAVALVACRVLMPESIRSPVDALASARSGSAAVAGSDALSLIQSPKSPGPAGGLVLDLLFCLPALLILARRAFDAEFRLLHSWSNVPVGLLGLLAILSPLWAADKFASLVSAMHLFCALVFLWGMFQLIRSWLRLRIIAGVCIGLLICLAMVGYNYHASEARDLRDTWNKNKSEILAQHGWAEGSFQAQNFEKRILNGQPPGFSTSTNTYAALLVILGVISAGVVAQRLADRDHWGWIVVPACAVIATPVLIHWTGCRAAYVTPIIAAMILLATGLLRPPAGKFSRIAYWLVVAIIGVATTVIIHHGVRTGTLWHDSLTFRWRYWTGAYRILTSGPINFPRNYSNFLVGVGWENFGPYYLAHRLAIAPEEIRDPHNFIVRTFVELGIIGGVLLLAWMLRLWWELTRPVVPSPMPPKSDEAFKDASGPVHYGQRVAFLTIASIAFIAIAINIAEAVDFDSSGDYVLLELIRRTIFLFMLCLGLICACIRRTRGPGAPADSGDIHLELDDRPAPWMLHAILAAVGTFLIHNLIEFSLFEPGPLFLFAMLGGAALGVRAQGARDARPMPASTKSPGLLGARIGVAVATLAWLAAAVFLAGPIVAAESRADDADADTAASFKSHDRQLLLKAAGEMTDASRDVPFNADYARRAAELLLALNGDRNDPRHTKQMLDAAVAADRSSVQNLVMRAQFDLDPSQKFELIDPAQIDAGLQDYKCAVRLDPRNVRMRLDYARELLRIAKLRHDPKLAGNAAFEFDSALDNNAQLPPEEVKRLTAKELADAEHDHAEAENIARPSTRP